MQAKNAKGSRGKDFKSEIPQIPQQQEKLNISFIQKKLVENLPHPKKTTDSESTTEHSFAFFIEKLASEDSFERESASESLRKIHWIPNEESDDFFVNIISPDIDSESSEASEEFYSEEVQENAIKLLGEFSYDHERVISFLFWVIENNYSIKIQITAVKSLSILYKKNKIFGEIICDGFEVIDAIDLHESVKEAIIGLLRKFTENKQAIYILLRCLNDDSIKDIALNALIVLNKDDFVIDIMLDVLAENRNSRIFKYDDNKAIMDFVCEVAIEDFNVVNKLIQLLTSDKKNTAIDLLTELYDHEPSQLIDTLIDRFHGDSNRDFREPIKEILCILARDIEDNKECDIFIEAMFLKHNDSLKNETIELFIDLMKSSDEIIICLTKQLEGKRSDAVKELLLSYLDELNKSTDEMEDVQEHEQLMILRKQMYGHLRYIINSRENIIVRKIAAEIFPGILEEESERAEHKAFGRHALRKLPLILSAGDKKHIFRTLRKGIHKEHVTNNFTKFSEDEELSDESKSLLGAVGKKADENDLERDPETKNPGSNSEHIPDEKLSRILESAVCMGLKLPPLLHESAYNLINASYTHKNNPKVLAYLNLAIAEFFKTEAVQLFQKALDDESEWSNEFLIFLAENLKLETKLSYVKGKILKGKIYWQYIHEGKLIHTSYRETNSELMNLPAFRISYVQFLAFQNSGKRHGNVRITKERFVKCFPGNKKNAAGKIWEELKRNNILTEKGKLSPAWHILSNQIVTLKTVEDIRYSEVMAAIQSCLQNEEYCRTFSHSNMKIPYRRHRGEKQWVNSKGKWLVQNNMQGEEKLWCSRLWDVSIYDELKKHRKTEVEEKERHGKLNYDHIPASQQIKQATGQVTNEKPESGGQLLFLKNCIHRD